MQKFIFSLIVLLFSATAYAAVEADDPMAAYYGNTWEYIGWDGTKHLHINADSTFKMLHHNAKIFDGTWTQDGVKTCFTVGDETSCFIDMTGRKVGVRWTGEHNSGNPYDGIIHSGRKPMEELRQDIYGSDSQ